MSFINTARKIERFRFYVSLLLIGVLFVGLAGAALLLPKAELVSADGTIRRIESYTDEGGEEQQAVFVSYTDANGVDHENVRYPSYSSSMKEGQTVPVLYDPSAPEEISSPGGEYLPYVFIAVGVLAIVVSILRIRAGVRKKQSNSPFEDSQRQVDPLLAEQVRRDAAPMKEYYFHWTGRMNQSYVLETPERKAVYEAICDHIGTISDYRYTFLNRITGASREHKISHTLTKRYGGESGGLSLSLVSASQFKIDDVINWDYLAELGYSVEPKQSGVKLNFDVLHHGVPTAFLEAAGTNILKDDANSLLGDKLPAAGLYKVRCKDADLEGVFMACFCVSRVEFY